MDLLTLYKVGFTVLGVFALFWSFVLDRNRPTSKKEFIAKLIARALFLMFIFTVLVGFCYYAFGLFEVPPSQ